MTDDEKRALKETYPDAVFIRVLHPLGEAILALPRKQSSPEKEAAVALWHGSIVKAAIHEGDERV